MSTHNNKILIIGLIWPEPEATAAGMRMMQLIHFFLRQGYELCFASAATKNDLSADLTALSITCLQIELNSSSFNKELIKLEPGIVLYDRFLTEEQYGWRVRQNCSTALQILDTEDLHFLRKSRELALKKDSDDWKSFLQNDITKREIASIYRSDLTLIISRFEYDMLREEFNIDATLLLYLPFLIDLDKEKFSSKLPDFDQRQYFMTIGNLNHQPNIDSIKHLYTAIWPLIRKKLPKAELHIFGAYASQAIKQLHNPQTGFLIKGWIPDKKEAFTNYRICLAPLRFGAGQKGKLLDAMRYGTPNITSSVGSEGMLTAKKWGGFIEDQPIDFATRAVDLHQDKEQWYHAQSAGFSLLKENYNKETFELLFEERLKKLTIGLEQHRKSNFIGSMLSHHQLQSSKYLSKWIETKNLLNDKIIE